MSIYILKLFLFGFVLTRVYSNKCDKKPLGSTRPASPLDGRFKLSVLGIDNRAYIPEQLYIVQISETDGESQMMGFMITAEGDKKPDPRNRRKTISLFPGVWKIQNPSIVKISEQCLYSVEQAMRLMKPSVEVYWQAPHSGSGCVTLRAMVAEDDDIWFEDEILLTKQLCEDLSQPDDVLPAINNECQVCNEAKYEVSFSGIWSLNTHPRLYPEDESLLRFSELVGASHTVNYILWAPDSLVSEAFQDLAENANSTKLEAEIREQVGDGVRTIIKGKGHNYPKMNNPSNALFRADKDHHLVTVAVAFHPTPDWFLGIRNFELCQEDNTWLPERVFNLFPWDAGTDSGISYESPNLVTSPKEKVFRVQLSSDDENSPFYKMEVEEMHPFGKLHIKLIRTYHRECEEITTEATEAESESPPSVQVEEEPVTNSRQPVEPSRYQNPEIDSSDYGGESPVVIYTKPLEECPMSDWREWSPCEGICENGKIIGYKWRERYHIVDGVEVEKYDPKAKRIHRKVVPKYCREQHETFERSYCEGDCTGIEHQEENLTAERRILSPILPGSSWRSRKREAV